MAPKDLDDEQTISRLLSEKEGLSIDEKESMFEQIYARHQREEENQQDHNAAIISLEPKPVVAARWMLLAAALAALIGASLFVRSQNQEPSHDGFTARGDHDSHHLSFSCGPNQGTTCKRGNTLQLLAKSDAATHVIIFAKHHETARVIWYIPHKEDGVSMEISNTLEPLPADATLGDEHPTGNYDLYAVFTQTPWTREQVKALFEQPDDPKKPTVRKRSFSLGLDDAPGQP